MEEIIKIIEEYKSALNRLMKVSLNQKTSTVIIESKTWMRKFLIIPLWILAGLFLFIAIISLTIDNVLISLSMSLLFTALMLFIDFLCIIFIRRITFRKTIDLGNGKFEFKGQLRKSRTFSLDEYEGAETLRTIKDFPEEVVVRFKTDKGTIRYKLADLNTGYARNIEPNHEAISALWDALIQAMTNFKKGDISSTDKDYLNYVK